MWESEGLVKVIEENRALIANSTPMQEVLRSFHRTAHTPLKDDLTLLSIQLNKIDSKLEDDVFDGEHAGLFK